MDDVTNRIRAAFEAFGIAATAGMIETVRAAAERTGLDPAELAREVAAGASPYFETLGD